MKFAYIFSELCSRIQLSYWETVKLLDSTFEAAQDGSKECSFDVELLFPITEAKLLTYSTQAMVALLGLLAIHALLVCWLL